MLFLLIWSAVILSYFTDEWDPVWRIRQDFIQNKLHHSDSKQHSDLEAQFLSAAVWDQEGGQIQTQEEQDGQHEVDNVEDRAPLHVNLWRVRWLIQIKAELKQLQVCGHTQVATTIPYVYWWPELLLEVVKHQHDSLAHSTGLATKLLDRDWILL